jgi:crossover junction endodeoxyribonuclease RusA
LTRELLTAFTIPGQPFPKERPRHGKGRTFTPQKTVDAEKAIIEAFDLACPLFEPSVEDLRIEADFYRQTRHAVDGDNLYKLLTDALNKVAYRDDRQIAQGEFRRFYGAGDKARTEVRIYILEGQP